MDKSNDSFVVSDVTPNTVIEQLWNDYGKQFLEEIVKELRRLEQDRNSVTHASWLPDEAGLLPWKFIRDKSEGVKLKEDVWTVDRLQELNDDIEKVHHDLMKHVMEQNKRGNEVFQVHDIGIVGDKADAG